MPAEKNQKQPETRTLKTLLEWKAPSRVFKKRNKEFFSTILTMAALIIIILALLKEWILILTVVSFVFLVFVMEKTPPEEVEHKITNRGIITGEKEYRWKKLKRFWFEEKNEKKILCVETITFPRILMMLLGQREESELRNVLASYLPEEIPPKPAMDRIVQWLAEKISLEEKS